MHILAGPCTRILGAMAMVLGAACGSGDDRGPGLSPPVVAKATTKSGDLQSGVVGTALPNDLRVVVTRDGEPASGVPVAWSTGSGSLNPSSAETDADGLSSSTWTLGDTPGPVIATASVTNATGSPVTFTATATEGGQGEIIVQVLSDAPRFDPEDIVVPVGTTVTWEWGAGATGHNVVPDDGDTPAASGALASAPHSYSYTFNNVGTFHYHCQAHGNVGGVGMSGTVSVVAPLP
jgi:plastocyanin